MNANELADELKKIASWSRDWNVLEQSEAMLRQQQAEIEALKAGGDPIAWTDKRQLSKPYPHSDSMTAWFNCYPEQGIDIPLYTHPAKTQLNLVNVVKNHIKDLQNCVKLFRSAEMDNTADEMEVAIKELENAINSHPAKTLTDEEIKQVIIDFAGKDVVVWDTDIQHKTAFARAILRKAQEK